MAHAKTVTLTEDAFRRRGSKHITWPKVGTVITVNILGEKVPYVVEKVETRQGFTNKAVNNHWRETGTVTCSLIGG